MTKIDIFYFASAMLVSGLLASCITPDPAPFPPNSPADPHVRSSSKPPRSLSRDETTREVERALAATQEEAGSVESMHHDMSSMPGMQQGDMSGMQHGQMKMEQPAGASQPEKKALEAEMKKTSEEMKATSDAMKQESDQKKRQSAAIYTCRMHPQIQSDQPGKCPICGMTLVKKKEK